MPLLHYGVQSSAVSSIMLWQDAENLLKITKLSYTHGIRLLFIQRIYNERVCVNLDIKYITVKTGLCINVTPGAEEVQ